MPPTTSPTGQTTPERPQNRHPLAVLDHADLERQAVARDAARQAAQS